jgi:hypothetical protein
VSWKESHTMKKSVCWDVTRCNRALYAACFMMISCLAYSSTLKMEETCSSEISDYKELNPRRQNSSRPV